MTEAKPKPCGTCGTCRTPRPTRNGVLVCTLCDRIDLMPIFRAPGE